MGCSFLTHFKEHTCRAILSLNKSIVAEHMSINNHNIKEIRRSLDLLYKSKNHPYSAYILDEFEIYKAQQKKSKSSI